MKYDIVIDGMMWSYSRLSSFQSCPYAWYMKYLVGYVEDEMFYSSYGSYIHKLIQLYYSGIYNAEDLPNAFLSGFTENVRGKRPSASVVNKYISSGIDYFRNFKPFNMNVLDVEKKFEFNVGDVGMVGYIDFIGESDGEIYIVDHKSRDLKPRSNRKNKTKNDEMLDKMLRQLYIYSIPVEKVYGKPSYLCFNCFRNGRFIKERFDEAAFEDAKKWVAETKESIKNTELFYPNIDYFYCKYICGLHDKCSFYKMEYGR